MLIDANDHQSLIDYQRRSTSVGLIYDVLVTLGARESERQDFYDYFMEPHTSYEWRFGGDFGFGGKFYENSGRWYVGYYPEDRTEERAARVEVANAELATLYAASHMTVT